MNDITLFLKKGTKFVLILIILLLIIFGLPLYIFLKSYEYYDINKVIYYQQNSKNNILFGPAYSNPREFYKLNSVSNNDFEVMALGTSRIMQLRAFMFNKSFYNAGGGIEKIGHLIPFVTNIPNDSKPKIIILCLDQYFFMPEQNIQMNDDIIQRLNSKSNLIVAFQTNVLKIYDQWLNGKIILNKLDVPGKIGLNAQMNGGGFRNDGSYDYGDTISNQNKTSQSRNTTYLENIYRNGKMYSDSVSPRALIHLENFLNYSKANGIYIISYSPPYSHDLWNAIIKNHNDTSIIKNQSKMISDLHQKYGFEYYDLSDMNSISGKDCEMINEFHSSEISSARILLTIAKNNSVMKSIINSDILKDGINNSPDCITSSIKPID